MSLVSVADNLKSDQRSGSLKSRQTLRVYTDAQKPTPEDVAQITRETFAAHLRRVGTVVPGIPLWSKEKVDKYAVYRLDL